MKNLGTVALNSAFVLVQYIYRERESLFAISVKRHTVRYRHKFKQWQAARKTSKTAQIFWVTLDAAYHIVTCKFPIRSLQCHDVLTNPCCHGNEN